MDRFDHRLLGVATGLGLAAAARMNPGEAAAAAVAAWATSGGRFSPDMDQHDSWQQVWRLTFRVLWWAVDLRVPGWRTPWRAFAWLVSGVVPAWRRERGQHGDPTQHRGITHWWGVPALWSLAAAPGTLLWPGPWWVPVWCCIAGWTSHLVGDWLFGRQVHGQHGHGVPLRPWWGHAGFTLPGKRLRRRGWPIPVAFRSAGWAAHVFALGGAVPASLWLVAVIAHL